VEVPGTGQKKFDFGHQMKLTRLLWTQLKMSRQSACNLSQIAVKKLNAASGSNISLGARSEIAVRALDNTSDFLCEIWVVYCAWAISFLVPGLWMREILVCSFWTHRQDPETGSTFEKDRYLESCDKLSFTDDIAFYECSPRGIATVSLLMTVVPNMQSAWRL
jgi:hypothetical protein